MKKSQKYLGNLYESLETATTVNLVGQQAKGNFLKEENRSFNHFNQFLGKCLNESFDDGLNAWANETVKGASLQHKVLVNFNSLMESLLDSSESFDSPIHQNVYAELEYLQDLDAEELTRAIQGGVLDEYGFIPEIAEINASLTEGKMKKLNENNHNVIYTPYSVLSESADGKTVVRLAGKNYAVGLDSLLYESEGAVSGDAVNDAIENVPYNDEEDRWELDSPVGMITLSPKEKCLRMNGDVKSCEELKESLSDAVQAEDSVLTQQDCEYLDDMIRLAENLDDIALLDTVRICENLVDHGTLVIFPSDTGTEVSVIEDGKLQYADNINDIIDHASENFAVAKSYLTESFKSSIKRHKLFEELTDAMVVQNEETRKELTEMLTEVENELTLVDAESPAAETLNEARTKILNELDALESGEATESVLNESVQELPEGVQTIVLHGITYLADEVKHGGTGAIKLTRKQFSQRTLAQKTADKLGKGASVYKPSIDRFYYVAFGV